MNKNSELDLGAVTVNCYNVKSDIEPRLKEIRNTVARLNSLVDQLTQVKIDSGIITPRGRLSKLRHSYGQVDIPKEFKKPVAKAQRELGQAVDNFWLTRRVIKDLGYRIRTATGSIIHYIESIPGYVEDASKYLEIWRESDRLLKFARSEELAVYHKILGLRARPPQSSTVKPGAITESESTMSKAEKREQIEKLLKQLKKSTDPAEKRKIRKALRDLGHAGGLNEPRGFTKKSSSKNNDEKPKAKKDAAKSEAPRSKKAAKLSEFEEEPELGELEEEEED